MGNNNYYQPAGAIKPQGQSQSSSSYQCFQTGRIKTYPQSATELRARVQGQGLKPVREGTIISGGLRSLFEFEIQERNRN